MLTGAPACAMPRAKGRASKRNLVAVIWQSRIVVVAIIKGRQVLKYRRLIVLLCAGICAGVCALPALAQDASRAPEAASGTTAKSLSVATRYMVAAAHPLAVDAGREMLRRGGSATDAAIATQLVLGLVEPQSSGLGGGAFLVHWDAAAKSVTTFDGRETAPAAAQPDRFLRDGRPLEFDVAVRSGLSVGVPGLVRMMELAHQRHGKLPWADLFQPAIALADKGFELPMRLATLLRLHGPSGFSDAARAYFFEANGAARRAGSRLVNPAYAETLRTLARDGARAFYEGPIADAIIAAVKSVSPNPGDLTHDDLAAYRAKERPALCITYKLRRICGMGPPSSGMMTVAQTLKLIEPMSELQGRAMRMSPAALHALAEAEKLAYADRNRFLADPDFVAVPDALLDDFYLAGRRAHIDTSAAMAKPDAGIPIGTLKRSFGIDATVERAGTSHISIIDADGNGIAMTTTIEGAFGAHQMAAGFLLNNQLTDFSFKPVDATGAPVANRIEGGKRPRSSMAPTLVFAPDGALEIVTGSPGGGRIIMFVVKVLVAMLDWDYDAQAAATLPNFGSDGGAFQIEDGFSAPWYWLRLRNYGHTVSFETMTSGIHTIARVKGRLEGGVDPRREGAARGD